MARGVSSIIVWHGLKKKKPYPISIIKNVRKSGTEEVKSAFYLFHFDFKEVPRFLNTLLLEAYGRVTANIEPNRVIDVKENEENAT